MSSRQLSRIGALLTSTALTLTLVACAGSVSSPAPSNTQKKDDGAKAANCDALNLYVDSDPTHLYLSNNWNTYKYLAYAEEMLWTKLSPKDEPSNAALMNLRLAQYRANGYDAPGIGQVITYDPSTQKSTGIQNLKFFSEAEETDFVDAAKNICTTMNTDFWDQYFHIRKYSIKKK